MGCDGLHRAHLCCAYPWEPFDERKELVASVGGEAPFEANENEAALMKLRQASGFGMVSVLLFRMCVACGFWDPIQPIGLFYLVLRGKKCNGMGNDVELVFTGSTANCE